MEDVSLKTRSRLWVAGYLAATIGTGLLAKTGLLPGWVSVALFLASFLLLIPMARAVERSRAACGMGSAASSRYNRRVIVSSLIYVVALFGGLTIVRQFDPPMIGRILLALLAALPIINIVRAMGLLLREETDEYLRSRLVEQGLIATGFLLTAATLYGFLNAFDVAPLVDAWVAVPVWAIGLGIAPLFRKEPSC